MSEATTAVDEPDATLVTEFVYNETNSEKKSWKFCNNVTLPRSEVVFVAQMVVILILNYQSCNKHIPHYNSRNHCALKKTKVFYDWLKNEQQREISESGDIPTTKFNALCVDDSRG